MRSILTLLLLCLLPLQAGAETSAPDYQADVAPILKKYCAGCHNDGDRDGDFSLESYASLQNGTEDGPAILPGDPGEQPHDPSDHRCRRAPHAA